MVEPFLRVTGVEQWASGHHQAAAGVLNFISFSNATPTEQLPHENVTFALFKYFYDEIFGYVLLYFAIWRQFRLLIEVVT